MGYDTDIASRLRAAGLRVVEIAGWQTAGSSSFDPRGSVNHHTAGPASGSAPSLNTCIYGRSDLPGPLCNVMQSREADGNDIAYVIAAGRANHAGEGGWRGLSGNSSVYGLEIEHTGTSPLSQHRQQIAARIHAAMFGGDAGMVCQHREWAPDRKIDAAQDVDPDTFRQMVAEGGGGTPTPTLEDTDMAFLIATPGKPIRLIVANKAIGLKDTSSVEGLKRANVFQADVTDRDYEGILAGLGSPSSVDVVS